MRRYQNGTLELSPTAAGDTYYLRFTNPAGVHPRRPRLRVGLKTDFKKKSDLDKRVRQLRDKFNAGELQPEVTYTVAMLIDRYEAEEMPERYSTAQGYQKMHRCYLRPRWGDTPLTAVAPLDVRAWLRDLRLRNGELSSTRTRGHVHTHFKNLLKHAMLWGWMPAQINPLSLFSLEGATKRTKAPRVLTPDQFRALVARFAENPMLVAMMTVAYLLGLRVSEILGLRWADVDWIEQTVKIERAVVRGHLGDVKTQHSKAPLPVPAPVIQALLRWKEKAHYVEETDFIFASDRHKGTQPVDGWGIQGDYLKPAGEKLTFGFPLGWHTFRHSYKSLLDRVSGDAALKRDLMRHADVHTTMQVYGESQMDRLRTANQAAADMALGTIKPN